MKKYLILALFLFSCERPEFLFTDGKGAKFADYEDQIIFLNIWADWCPPCIIEFPYFNEINEEPNVTVIGFHFDQFDTLPNEEVNRLMNKFNVILIIYLLIQGIYGV